ncbi:hypothetical protein Tco_0374391 [Tanacetum coccineum]
MGDENPIRTLGDFSKPSHEGYRTTIDLLVGNNMVPFLSDTIRLVQNGCSFQGIWSEDPNQHFKDFLKLVGSLDLDSENRERTHLRLFQFSLHDQASNWLERLPTGFLAQFFPPGRTAKLCNDILIFQKHHGDSFSKAWTHFKDLLQKVPHHGIDLWLQKILEDLALYDNESWNDPMDFAKSVKAITLPQNVASTSDCRLIELENQVQRLMEAYLAPTQPTQVNKITTPCEICSGPHDTQNCMENPEQAFVEYASSHTNKAGGKWFTFKPEQNNLSWKINPNLSFEPIYDVWTRFKNLIKRVPHHGLDSWSLTQFFYDHVEDYTRMDLDFTTDGNLRELSGEEAWEAIENFAQGQKEKDNPPNIISEQEVANLKAYAKRLFGNENVWVQMHRVITWDKVENPDPQSTPQVLPLFEEYTPLATYPKDVEETLGIPIEVEPLDETPLEDLGLNTVIMTFLLALVKFLVLMNRSLNHNP